MEWQKPSLTQLSTGNRAQGGPAAGVCENGHVANTIHKAGTGGYYYSDNAPKTGTLPNS